MFLRKNLYHITGNRPQGAHFSHDVIALFYIDIMAPDTAPTHPAPALACPPSRASPISVTPASQHGPAVPSPHAPSLALLLEQGVHADAHVKARVLEDAKTAKRPPLLGTMCVPFWRSITGCCLYYRPTARYHYASSLMVTGMRESIIRKRASQVRPYS